VDIVSDPSLRQVVGNIVDNAIEVSPQGISITAHRHHDSLVVTATDHGPGFDRQILEQIGKPYASTKGRPGGGLGCFWWSMSRANWAGGWGSTTGPRAGRRFR
jgi:two-component system sensor histidine kinase RegB